MTSFSLKWLLTFILFIFSALISLVETALSRARQAKLQELLPKNPKAYNAISILSHSEFFFLLLQFILFATTLAIGILGFGIFQHSHHIWLELFSNFPLYLSFFFYLIAASLLLYFYILLGRLIPRQFAFRRAEKILILSAPYLQFFFYLFYPILRPLALLTKRILNALGMTLIPESLITEEEIKGLIEQGKQAGTFEAAEQDIVERVFRLADRKVSLLMIPRYDVVYIDLEDEMEENYTKVLNSPYSHFPVVKGDLDNIIGTVYIKEILNDLIAQKTVQIDKIVYSPLFIPENVTALHLLEIFKKSTTQIAFIVDEYGSFQGLITLKDILEAIVGDLPSVNSPEDPLFIQQENGAWQFDGMILIEEMKALLNIADLPKEKEGGYQTLAGFIVTYLGRIPETGNTFATNGWHFTVAAMVGNRIDKVIISTDAELNP